MENIVNEIVYRPYTSSDYPQVKSVMQIVYSDLEDAYPSEEEMDLLSALYPEGQILCLNGDEVIGAAFSRIAEFKKYSRNHSQADMLNQSQFIEDSLKGDGLYFMEVFIKPAYQQLKIAKQLHALLEKQSFKDNFCAIYGVSRLANYHQYQYDISPEVYAQKVKNREIKDFALGFHLSNGVLLGDIFPNHNPDDHKSLANVVFVYVPNPNYDPTQALYSQVYAEHFKQFLT